MLAEYDRAREAPVAGEYSKYYTGEAYWALARLHRAFPDEGWGETADRIGAYLATSRDEVEGYWPPIPDHWAAYGQAETVEFPDRGAAAADRATSWITRASRPGCSACRRAGWPRVTGPGACGARPQLSRAGAGTEWSARRSPAGG